MQLLLSMLLKAGEWGYPVFSLPSVLQSSALPAQAEVIWKQKARKPGGCDSLLDMARQKSIELNMKQKITVLCFIFSNMLKVFY